MAVKDLEVYHKALDQALLQYHGDKMQAINEVLKEYWRDIYQGKDIDEIYLQAEPAEQGRGRRSYNYRVIMRSGDTEMDMRGRCSAGQKVLACLLIRLALAETFCLRVWSSMHTEEGRDGIMIASFSLSWVAFFDCFFLSSSFCRSVWSFGVGRTDDEFRHRQHQELREGSQQDHRQTVGRKKPFELF